MTDFNPEACRTIEDPYEVARLWVSHLEGGVLSPSELERVSDFEDRADTLGAWPVYAAALEFAHGRASFTAIGWQHLQYYLLYMDDAGGESGDSRAAQLVEPIAASLSSHRALGLFAAEWISIAANGTAPWAGAVLASALASRIGLPWGRHLDALRVEWEDSRSLPLAMQVPELFGDPSVPRNVLATRDPQAAIAVSELPDLPPPAAIRWKQWAAALRDVTRERIGSSVSREPDMLSVTRDRDVDPVQALMREGATLLQSMTDDRRGPTCPELRRTIDLADATMAAGKWPIWGAVRRILTAECSLPSR